MRVELTNSPGERDEACVIAQIRKSALGFWCMVRLTRIPHIRKRFECILAIQWAYLLHAKTLGEAWRANSLDSRSDPHLCFSSYRMINRAYQANYER